MSEKSTTFPATEDGNVITAEDGSPIVVEIEKKVVPEVIASIYRKMEILICNLS